MKEEKQKEELIRKVLEIVAKKRPDMDQILFASELKKIKRDAVELELSRWEMLPEIKK